MRVRKPWRLGLLACVGLAAGQTAADVFQVDLLGMEFMYNGQSNMNIDLVIAPGDTVRWVWVEGAHNVVSGAPDDPDRGSLFHSGSPRLPPFEFEHTFDDPGVYFYHCEPHAIFGMVSFVTVCNPCDANCDGAVNASDIQPFLGLLFDGDAPCGAGCAGDTNGDGLVTAQDIQGFIDCLFR